MLRSFLSLFFRNLETIAFSYILSWTFLVHLKPYSHLDPVQAEPKQKLTPQSVPKHNTVIEMITLKIKITL